MGDFAPTREQADIQSAFGRGENLVINAFAGSGKSTTLLMLAESAPTQRILYACYNAVAKKDAAAKFPRNTTCKTSHGLAYGPMIHMATRVGPGGKFLGGSKLARLMGITSPARLTKDLVLAPGQVASLVKTVIQKFCYSDSERIDGSHVPADLKRYQDPDVLTALRQIIPPIAQRVWDTDITSADGAVPMEHDYYLKAYCLTHPNLSRRFGVIFVDEAQDSNPCFAQLIREQLQHGVQIVLVGDTFQAIYGWRGAVDSMADFALLPGVKLMNITQSFRFGPAVAEEAGKWLRILGCPTVLQGFEKIQSRIGEAPDHPDAILCRTNAEALKRAMAAITEGLTVAYPKGTGEMAAMVEAAADIKRGEPTTHPDLMAFITWGQVQDFVENQEPGYEDLELFAELVDEYGTDELLAILKQIGNESKGAKADITISTGHQAKGREWAIVEIAEDWPEPKPDPDHPLGLGEIPRELAMLAYVAVTRAQYVLNRAGLAWIDAYVAAAAATLELAPAAEGEAFPEPGEVLDAIYEILHRPAEMGEDERLLLIAHEMYRAGLATPPPAVAAHLAA